MYVDQIVQDGQQFERLPRIESLHVIELCDTFPCPWHVTGIETSLLHAEELQAPTKSTVNKRYHNSQQALRKIHDEFN